MISSGDISFKFSAWLSEEQLKLLSVMIKDDSYVEHITNPLVEDFNAPYRGIKNSINEARKACEYALTNHDNIQALRCCLKQHIMHI